MNKILLLILISVFLINLTYATNDTKLDCYIFTRSSYENSLVSTKGFYLDIIIKNLGNYNLSNTSVVVNIFEPSDRFRELYSVNYSIDNLNVGDRNHYSPKFDENNTELFITPDPGTWMILVNFTNWTENSLINTTGILKYGLCTSYFNVMDISLYNQELKNEKEAYDLNIAILILAVLQVIGFLWTIGYKFRYYLLSGTSILISLISFFAFFIIISNIRINWLNLTLVGIYVLELYVLYKILVDVIKSKKKFSKKIIASVILLVCILILTISSIIYNLVNELFLFSIIIEWLFTSFFIFFISIYILYIKLTSKKRKINSEINSLILLVSIFIFIFIFNPIKNVMDFKDNFTVSTMILIFLIILIFSIFSLIHEKYKKILEKRKRNL